jgi:diguanylate cyclase (GGDEF)-like protein/PAS domain S-box-containing protein
MYHTFSDTADLTLASISTAYLLSPPGKILVVDGSAVNLRILSAALMSHDYDVRCVKSGAAAIKALKVSLPNLILLDIHLPKLDGFTVCQRLKANPKTQHIPIIFMSHSATTFDKVKAFELGGVDYITRPFQVEEVLVRVRNQLELQAARKRLAQLNNDLEQRVLQRTLQLQTVHHRLKASEERLESILNTLEDVVWSAAISPFQILYLNPAAITLYQRPIEDFLLNSNLWFEVIHPDDRAEVWQSMQTMTTRGSIDIEYRIMRPHGESRCVRNRSHIVIGDNDSVAIRMEGIITDISERKRAEKQLIFDALHDGLTHLPNRTLFTERLESALIRKQRWPEYNFAVLFLDLDRFKVINDSLGHVAGDQLLIKVADRLMHYVRASDTVARLGGDEFTILLDQVSKTSDVINLVKQIQAALMQPIEVNGSMVFTSASIGIVMATQDYKTASELLRDADIAMYRAKENRKPGYELFNRVMYAQTMRRLKLENDLRGSLENQEFDLLYQPIFSLKGQNLLGFEALIRWLNPEEGVINPNEFIHIAEETGLIVPLGNWVLEKACRQIKTWQQRYADYRHLKINVNMTSHQFREPSLISTLDRILQEVGLAGCALRLELTESTLIQDTETTVETLRQIRQRNIQISIDDFGTGYSSLSYLSRFPINNLKIDRSFVSRMHLDTDNFEIVRTITSLAHTLGMDVTAEGIELETQLLLLEDLDCEFGQGYFFSYPLDVAAADALLATWR